MCTKVSRVFVHIHIFKMLIAEFYVQSIVKKYYFGPRLHKKKNIPKGVQTLETLMFVIGPRETHYFGLNRIVKRIVNYNRTELNNAPISSSCNFFSNDFF